MGGVSKKSVFIVIDMYGYYPEDSHESCYMAFDTLEKAEECAEKHERRVNSRTTPDDYSEYVGTKIAVVELDPTAGNFNTKVLPMCSFDCVGVIDGDGDE